MDDKNRRGRPQQQIYRPGSGPLRKSAGFDETESDTNLVLNSRQSQTRTFSSQDDFTNRSEGNSPRTRTADLDNVTGQYGDMSLHDGNRRNKKPEQQRYVPPHAQPREICSNNESIPYTQGDRNQPQVDRNCVQTANGDDRSFLYQNDRYSGPGSGPGSGRSKRYSNRRRVSEEWRDKSPAFNNRQARQGSEPRNSANNGGQWQRSRDTRSVEPSNINYNDRFNTKPPSGRRHSTVGLDMDKRFKQANLDNLPPRFRKKLLEEGKLIGSKPVEENWDGKSLTFQGSSNHPDNTSSRNPFINYATLPGIYPQDQSMHDSSIYCTLRNKSRGRGRNIHHYPHSEVGTVYRPQTPDRIVHSPQHSRPNSRPSSPFRKASPLRFKSNDNNYNQNSRPQTPTNFPRSDNRHSARSGDDHDIRNLTDERFKRNDNKERFERRNENRFNEPNKNSNRTGSDRNNRNGDEKLKRNDNKGRFDRRSEDRFSERGFNRSRQSDSQNVDLRNKLESRNNDGGKSNNALQPQSAINESLISKNISIPPSIPSQNTNVISESEKTPINVPEHHSDLLDWSEEVELHERLETEALSDNLTRSSSLASLVENSSISMPITSSSTSNSKKSRKSWKKGKRSKSRRRDRSLEAPNLSRQDSCNSSEKDKDCFKVPEEPRSRRRRNSRNRRDSSFDRFRNKSRNHSRDRSSERNRRASTSEHENWREECVDVNNSGDAGFNRQSFDRNRNSQRSRNNSERSSCLSDKEEQKPGIERNRNLQRSRNNSERSCGLSDKEEHKEMKGLDFNKGGILVLQKSPPTIQPSGVRDHPKFPDVVKSTLQKSLYDPQNPNKPIIVQSNSSRVSVPGFSDDNATAPPQMITDQYGNVLPNWYDEDSTGFKNSRYKDVIRNIKRADSELQSIISRGYLLQLWGNVEAYRHFLKEALMFLLCKDLKFCQSENFELHMWKLLYYHIIETTRKAMAIDTANKEQYKGFLLYVIDEGTKYFEALLDKLEETYDFKLNNYLGNNQNSCLKSSSYVKLALVSAQKIFLILGDLSRYREQINDSSNFGKCRQWYIKANEINPKNGRPYYQLAVLAMYSRRKLDAVYYYMRSLMSSNPYTSAKESLVTLFDEIRKKYEQGERKRREERLERARQHMKQKESEEQESNRGSLRREIWIRPDGGRRVHRTTQAVQEEKDSEEEDLAALGSVEVNKRFVISYLHVQGKLISKIGMESFQEAAMQMLKEFRALLQHSPVPLPCNRFLQLLALNMFSIEYTQLKDPQLNNYRSEQQECALVVSLQMFSVILERCVSLLQDQLGSVVGKELQDFSALSSDLHVLLPAVKIWCDWLLCHSSVWNPPPSTQDYRVGSSGDVWNRLATLMNLLEQLKFSSIPFPELAEEEKEDHDLIRLPEDSVLSGFTPLMCNIQKSAYAPKESDPELAQFSLRLTKVLFFGTEFLCGLEPPVLKLEIEDEFREYVSVVRASGSPLSTPSPRELASTDEVLESFSSDEEVDFVEPVNADASEEVKVLLSRKNELERKHKKHELHMQRVRKILSQSVISVQIEVRPRFLVPDTNCFIDHLDRIRTIAGSHVYSLMVPIVVLSELEGLGRGGKCPTPAYRQSLDSQHLLRVAESARKALEFLKCKTAAVKCVTTKGAILTSTAFTTEDDSSLDCNLKNDDKILATCLVLGKGHKETETTVEGEPRKLVQEVVLLTDDRNLRVKALARNVPVRELPDFMQWAGLG